MTTHPVAAMLEAWADYADNHARRLESSIGEDYVLGPPWGKIGAAIHELLNGDCGSLDCGAASGFIMDRLHDNGFDDDGEPVA